MTTNPAAADLQTTATEIAEVSAQLMTLIAPLRDPRTAERPADLNDYDHVVDLIDELTSWLRILDASMDEYRQGETVLSTGLVEQMEQIVHLGWNAVRIGYLAESRLQRAADLEDQIMGDPESG